MTAGEYVIEQYNKHHASGTIPLVSGMHHDIDLAYLINLINIQVERAVIRTKGFVDGKKSDHEAVIDKG